MTEGADLALGAPARSALDALVSRYGLTERQREQLIVVLGRLAADELAPTSVREPERAVDVHLADSLVALDIDAIGSASTVVDIGAGAGFPGLPLAVALPACQVTLVDSQARKCAYVERVVADAPIENAAVVCARVEEWPEGIEAHDVVVARAVAAQPIVLEYAAPLLRVGGSLVDWRGRRDAKEEGEALAAATHLGLERREVRRVAPYEQARDLNLHVYLKVRDTPSEFPRRVGTAMKRPLAKRA